MQNPDKEPRIDLLEEDLSVINSRYGINIDLDQTTTRKWDRLGFARQVNYETLSRTNASLPVRTIRQELSLYPPEYIRTLRLRRINLVRDFEETSFGRKIPEVGGIPLPKIGLMYLNVGRGDFGMIDLIQNLHHEITHFLDEDMVGFRGRKRRNEWVNLNPNGSRAYKVNEEYFSNRNLDVERPTGFASFYGKFSPEEDRAEVANLVMTMARAKTGYLRTLIQSDEALNAKVHALLETFKQRSGGKIDDGFLDDLMGGRIKENYWDQK